MVVRSLFDHFHFQFGHHFQVSFVDFVGRDYERHFATAIQPECVLDLLKLHLTLLILRKEEAEYTRFVVVS